MLRLAQVRTENGRAVALIENRTRARLLNGTTSIYALAQRAIAQGASIEELVSKLGAGESIDIAMADFLPPIDHPDPAHLYVTGTGLTHLGSAEGRDKMHRDLKAETLTDSMKMFKLGLDGGKPDAGQAGVQPEWFYKGDGSTLVAPGAPLMQPKFALNGGEEPEIVGLYLIGPDGAPWRIGYALGNEFSDHVTERQNYLYLAHSKLRQCAIGPEVLIGELPADVRGASRIWRGNEVVWEKPFLSGEAHMCHTIANLEHHHFKYGLFRRPGDLHAHFFGTATLSFSDNIEVRQGDEFEIEADAFVLPLRNPLNVEPGEAGCVTVKAL